MTLFLIHFTLAVILFFIQNWIGSRSYSIGYIRFSLLDDKDEALSTNFAIKVFGPIIYIIICATILQYFGLERFNYSIINVIYYYLGLRILMIFLYERWSIVNWGRIIFYYASIILISLVVYNNFIEEVGILLPDFTELKNEIWLLVLIFLFQLGNGFVEKMPNNQLYESTRAYLPELKKRKKNYILKKNEKIEKKYGNTITSISKGNEPFNIMICSIIIYENFNRPPFVRFIERVYVRFTKRKVTQGIMQSPSYQIISDEESVIMGTNSLYKFYEQEQGTHRKYARTIKHHCPDRKYVRQILFIAKCIIDDAKKQKQYQDLYDEIIYEFDLYGL